MATDDAQAQDPPATAAPATPDVGGETACWAHLVDEETGRIEELEREVPTYEDGA